MKVWSFGPTTSVSIEVDYIMIDGRVVHLNYIDFGNYSIQTTLSVESAMELNVVIVLSGAAVNKRSGVDNQFVL